MHSNAIMGRRRKGGVGKGRRNELKTTAARWWPWAPPHPSWLYLCTSAPPPKQPVFTTFPAAAKLVPTLLSCRQLHEISTGGCAASLKPAFSCGYWSYLCSFAGQPAAWLSVTRSGHPYQQTPTCLPAPTTLPSLDGTQSRSHLTHRTPQRRLTSVNRAFPHISASLQA